jgi:hypothetical protein
VTAASGSDLLKSLQAKVSREKRPTAIAPQLESDAVCPIRIHARYKLSADGSEFADELYLYRPVGQRMVSLTLVTAVHTEQEVDAVHQTAEALLAGADLPGAAKKPAAVASTTRPAPAGLPDVNITLPSGPLHRTTKVKVAAATPAKALTLAKAKLRLPALPGWTVESTDQTSGCVAVYRDEQNKSKIIMVTVHPLPPEVRDDAAARQAVISDLVQGEQATLNLPNSQPSGKPETITDSRFLRKVRQSYDVQKIKVQVDLRSLVAGDAVVCVVSAAQGDAADAAADTQKSADDLALGIKPVGK